MSVDARRTAQSYWDTAAKTYDCDFTGTLIGQLRRRAVWRELDRTFQAGQRVLELNCGTGIDAVRLAGRGVRVLACDISLGMIDMARERANACGVAGALQFRVLPTEEIARLGPEGPFEGAFSNFAGLNCVDDLGATAEALFGLLKPGATVLLCMLGRFVPWEMAWYVAQAQPGRAFLRWSNGTARQVEGGTLRVRYHGVGEIARLFAPRFRLRRWRGIGIMVPPTYAEVWARRVPRLTRAVARVDDWIGGIPVVRRMADLVLLELERRW